MKIVTYDLWNVICVLTTTTTTLMMMMTTTSMAPAHCTTICLLSIFFFPLQLFQSIVSVRKNILAICLVGCPNEWHSNNCQTIVHLHKSIVVNNIMDVCHNQKTFGRWRLTFLLRFVFLPYFLFFPYHAVNQCYLADSYYVRWESKMLFFFSSQDVKISWTCLNWSGSNEVDVWITFLYYLNKGVEVDILLAKRSQLDVVFWCLIYILFCGISPVV